MNARQTLHHWTALHLQTFGFKEKNKKTKTNKKKKTKAAIYLSTYLCVYMNGGGGGACVCVCTWKPEVSQLFSAVTLCVFLSRQGLPLSNLFG
jgi:hypothetical protein